MRASRHHIVTSSDNLYYLYTGSDKKYGKVHLVLKAQIYFIFHVPLLLVDGADDTNCHTHCLQAGVECGQGKY